MEFPKQLILGFLMFGQFWHQLDAVPAVFQSAIYLPVCYIFASLLYIRQSAIYLQILPCALFSAPGRLLWTWTTSRCELPASYLKLAHLKYLLNLRLRGSEIKWHFYRYLSTHRNEPKFQNISSGQMCTPRSDCSCSIRVYTVCHSVCIFWMHLLYGESIFFKGLKLKNGPLLKWKKWLWGADWKFHHKACWVMPNSYPEWRNFQFAPNNHYWFFFLHTLRQLHSCLNLYLIKCTLK